MDSCTMDSFKNILLYIYIFVCVYVLYVYIYIYIYIYIYTVSQKSEYTHHISAVNLVYISRDNTIEMKLGYILE